MKRRYFLLMLSMFPLFLLGEELERETIEDGRFEYNYIKLDGRRYPTGTIFIRDLINKKTNFIQADIQPPGCKNYPTISFINFEEWSRPIVIFCGEQNLYLWSSVSGIIDTVDFNGEEVRLGSTDKGVLYVLVMKYSESISKYYSKLNDYPSSHLIKYPQLYILQSDPSISSFRKANRGDLRSVHEIYFNDFYKKYKETDDKRMLLSILLLARKAFDDESYLQLREELFKGLKDDLMEFLDKSVDDLI